MRQMRLLAALTALAAGALSSVAPAEAGRLLVFDNDRSVPMTSRRCRTLRWSAARPAADQHRACSQVDEHAGRAHVEPAGPGEARALARASRRTDPGRRSRPLSGRSTARRSGCARGLDSTRARELGYVIDTLRRSAAGSSSPRAGMPALFLILDRNREWWGSKGPPASSARVRFAPSEVIFQYYPGRGLQLQPLANFGFANGLWQSNKDERLRALIERAGPAARRAAEGSAPGSTTSHFGGGSPPWISGMAQATAMQALARAGTRLGDPSLLEIASEGRGGVRAAHAGRRPRVGCRPAPGTRSTASRRGWRC